MKKSFKIFLLSAGLALLILSSCQSPSDIDSPTKKIPVTKDRITPNLTDIKFDENGELRYFTVSKTSALIDTLSDVPYVWMDLSFETNENISFDKDSLCISHFSIKLDSLPIVALIDSILGKPESSSWSSFIIESSKGISTDTLYSGMGRNKTNVSFSFDKGRREMNAYIYTRLIMKQSSDTSFFRATLKFQY